MLLPNNGRNKYIVSDINTTCVANFKAPRILKLVPNHPVISINMSTQPKQLDAVVIIPNHDIGALMMLFA